MKLKQRCAPLQLVRDQKQLPLHKCMLCQDKKYIVLPNRSGNPRVSDTVKCPRCN
jgi:hypothetical protein